MDMWTEFFKRVYEDSSDWEYYVDTSDRYLIIIGHDSLEEGLKGIGLRFKNNYWWITKDGVEEISQ